MAQSTPESRFRTWIVSGLRVQAKWIRLIQDDWQGWLALRDTSSEPTSRDQWPLLPEERKPGNNVQTLDRLIAVLSVMEREIRIMRHRAETRRAEVENGS